MEWELLTQTYCLSREVCIDGARGEEFRLGKIWCFRFRVTLAILMLWCGSRLSASASLSTPRDLPA
jgi:hypothetical protein